MDKYGYDGAARSAKKRGSRGLLGFGQSGHTDNVNRSNRAGARMSSMSGGGVRIRDANPSPNRVDVRHGVRLFGTREGEGVNGEVRGCGWRSDKCHEFQAVRYVYKNGWCGRAVNERWLLITVRFCCVPVAGPINSRFDGTLPSGLAPAVSLLPVSEILTSATNDCC